MAELLKMVNELSLGYKKIRRQEKIPGDNSLKKKHKVHCHPGVKQLENRVANPDFDCFKQVRILLFRERFGQEKRLLFDSRAVRKRDGTFSERKEIHNCSISESSIERSFKLNNAPENEYVIEWPKQNSDQKMLREMIFGSVSTSYQGTTFKIHTIKSPPQIVLSVVFPAPSMASFRFGEHEGVPSSSVSSCAYDIVMPKQSSSTDIHSAHSVPVDVPHFSFEENNEDNCDSSGSFHSHSGNTSLPGCADLDGITSSLIHSGSYSSLQRRLLRNKATSIELGFQTTDDGCTYGGEIFKVQGESRIKLGLSVVVAFDDKNSNEERSFQDFLFTHISLIENHLMDLKSAVIKAYLIRKKFICYMYEGAIKFIQSLQDLCGTPRLHFPKWLSIVSSDNRSDLSQIFMEEFSFLLEKFDRKETNFFVSTLLTAVLTNHLSWVPTIIPPEEELCCEHTNHEITAQWVHALAKSRPYNPLWVQLSDLYGALSHPLKIVKVVITGTRADVITKFLRVLSYFIRCSEICEEFQEETSSVHGVTHARGGHGHLNGKAKHFNNEISLKSSVCSELPSSFQRAVEDECKSFNRKTDDFRMISDKVISHQFHAYEELENEYRFGPLKEAETEKQPHSSDFDCRLQSSLSSRNSDSMSVNKSLCKQTEMGEEGYQSMEENLSSGCESLPLSDDSLLSEEWSPEDLLKFTIPEYLRSKGIPNPSLHKSLGWSLMAGVNKHFITDFCLQGVEGCVSDDEVHLDLLRSTQVRTFGEPVSEAVCVLADSDTWHVKVLSVQHSVVNQSAFSCNYASMSTLISNMCEAVLSLKELGIPPESCIVHIEDKLREFYSLSLAFFENMQSFDASRTMENIALSMGLDKSDIPLVTAIASTQLPWTKVFK